MLNTRFQVIVYIAEPLTFHLVPQVGILAESVMSSQLSDLPIYSDILLLLSVTF